MNFLRTARKMGLIKDQEGIFRRYLAESAAWEEHLMRTKKFITDFLDSMRPSSVSILGSGWMLDVPASYLAENIKEVVFYDIRHPKPIIRKFSRDSNFRFITTDLTGGLLKKIYTLCKKRGPISFDEIRTLFKELDCNFQKETEAWVSVNLLNQLDILIVDYLLNKTSLNGEEIKLLRKQIQAHHLEMLPEGRSCLITDYEEIHTDRQGEARSSRNLIFTSLPEGHYQEEWTWDFDNHRTYHPQWNTKLKVKAIRY